MRNVIERLMTEGRRGNDFNSPGEKRFFGDMFSWTTEPEFAQFLTETNLPEIAARVMNAANVRLFYDQLFVKEPGTPARTPWHQDLSYWPVEGEQILSIWIPFDELHHPLTIHGAPGNATQDDARWVERPEHFMRMPKVREMMEALDISDLQAGDRFDGKLFPRIWPK